MRGTNRASGTWEEDSPPRVHSDLSKATARRQTRRAVVKSLTGLGVFGFGWQPRRAAAQDAAATPVAEGPDAGRAGANLPPGLRIGADGGKIDAEPERGGSVRLVRPGSSIGNFNPVAFAQDPQIPLSYLEPLVRTDASTMQPDPFLAERWEWRNGGLELVFTLREGVVWQDGAPFNAQDVAFSFAVYQHDAESAVSALFALVESIEADADRVLIVRFSERDANWLFNAATLPVFSRLQDQEYW
jgi:ABC-type transport system substrate-binding protein